MQRFYTIINPCPYYITIADDNKLMVSRDGINWIPVEHDLLRKFFQEEVDFIEAKRSAQEEARKATIFNQIRKLFQQV